MKARLVLENGKVFEGEMFGACKDVAGEVVFSSGMGGYQESLTDPSFAGQIVTMTFPLIGNYGINLEDMESDKASPRAIVVREKCDAPSNFRNEMTLDYFLKQQGVVGIEGIDTRALTRLLRNSGVMKGAIVSEKVSVDDALKMMEKTDDSNVVMSMTTPAKYVVNPAGKKKVALIDLGVKESILRQFKIRDCSVEVFPANTSADEILSSNPDLVCVSNGPGSPEDIPFVVETVKAIVGKAPICGICTGHLVVALALGATVEKMKFGHHGESQPVKELATGKVYVTAQGHTYVVSELPEDVYKTYENVNDATCEGLKHSTLPIESVQFHPEAAPGPLETEFIFDKFVGLM